MAVLGIALLSSYPRFTQFNHLKIKQMCFHKNQQMAVVCFTLLSKTKGDRYPTKDCLGKELY